jgi:iron(III) transport system ATP-binding protein
MVSVRLSQVRKSFGTSRVVRDITFEVRPGELVALLGPSGCGKTTTLRMIAGLERPDAGRIAIGDLDVDGPGVHVPTERRGLGMVFQSYAVWPHRSVFDNVAYPLVLQKLPRAVIRERVEQSLDWVRLRALSARMPDQLSGGQLQRVAIARALVATPKVLLLDEPLSNLDAVLREELRGEIAALRARLGITTIFVTHDQGEALALADRVAVMNAGRIEQLATPQVIYREPSTAFIAGFVGGANCLVGRIHGDRFHLGGASLPLPLQAADGPCTLVVRPEDVRLSDVGVAAPVPAVITARLFLGNVLEYRVALGDQVLRVRAAANSPWGPGLSVNIQLDRVAVFRDAPGTSS